MPLEFAHPKKANKPQNFHVLPKYTLQKIGTDTEIFLREKKTKKPVPVIGLLGGTKEEPLNVPELGKGFAVQEDNVMPEFNVPAARNSAEFSENISKMLTHLKQTFDAKGLSLHINPSCTFTEAQLAHPQAQRIGCEGDYCVWTRSLNPNPKDAPELKTLRSAGGHIHVSFLVDGEYPNDILQVEEIVKGMDAYLGLASVILDKDKLRKKLYGKAGAFRPKPYGVEYRTLSNFWIKSPAHTTWVFETIRHIFSYLSDCRRAGRNPWWNQHGTALMEIINSQDVATAQTYMAAKHITLPEENVGQ